MWFSRISRSYEAVNKEPTELGSHLELRKPFPIHMAFAGFSCWQLLWVGYQLSFLKVILSSLPYKLHQGGCLTSSSQQGGLSRVREQGRLLHNIMCSPMWFLMTKGRSTTFSVLYWLEANYRSCLNLKRGHHTWVLIPGGRGMVTPLESVCHTQELGR